MQHGAQAFQAAGAALQACLKTLKDSYPKQAASLAVATLKALAEVGSHTLPNLLIFDALCLMGEL